MHEASFSKQVLVLILCVKIRLAKSVSARSSVRKVPSLIPSSDLRSLLRRLLSSYSSK